MGDGAELALGTVTEVTTTNKWHEDPAFRGALAEGGEIPGMSGDEGDSRRARIRVQAAWRRANPECPWEPSGPSLRMSPATGTPARVITADLVRDLTATASDLHYMGHLMGSDNIPLPLSLPDFASSQGAWHGAVFGLSGAGKALDVDTPILTTAGWVAMGDLRKGDHVFDENGQPCTVVAAHDVMTDRPCYEIRFSDGSTIVADAEHQWLTHSAAARRSASAKRNKKRVGKTRLARKVIEALKREANRTGPLDVISAPEVQRQFGITGTGVLMREAAAVAGIAGEIRPLREFHYKGKTSTGQKTQTVYPARELVTTLAHQCETRPTPRWSATTAKALRAAAVNFSDGDRITAPDVARIIGAPARNGALRRRIKESGVPSARLMHPFEHAAAPQTVVRQAGPVTVYPKASLLRALAELGEQGLQDQSDKRRLPSVVTTAEIAASLTEPGSGSRNHAIPVAGALQYPPASLPLSPYALGAWLGDGDSASAVIHTADPEILDNLEAVGVATKSYAAKYAYGMRFTPERAEQPCPACGAPVTNPRAYTCGPRCRPEVDRAAISDWPTRTVSAALRELGVLGRKHIPESYLTASEQQRRDLLAGLLDTDGTVAPRGACQYTSTNSDLARDVHRLAISLGYRATLTEGRARLKGRDCGPKWIIAFTTCDDVFRLTRKRRVHQERSAHYSEPRNSFRYVTEVKRVRTRPVRCITVDSDSHLFLAGHNLVPTHNTQITALLLAGKSATQQSQIIIDPQGQWASEQDMVFSLQGFSAEMGRDVRVHRISDDLRLAKDAPLFTSLLQHTRLVVELGLKHESTQEIVWYEITKALRERADWTGDDSETLLRALLSYLSEETTAGRIYTTPDNQARFQQRVLDLLADNRLFKEALNQFAPIHNLFQATNAYGHPRHSLSSTLRAVFSRSSQDPAALVILDMSTRALPGMDDTVDEATEQALAILDSDSVKAAILRNLFHTLKRESEKQFRDGNNLNTMIVLDEAWRYAAPPNQIEEDEIAALSRELAGYARDTRKFGIGWLYITQSTRSLNADIWSQLSVRIFGYGLTGGDLDRASEVVDDPNVLRLYRTFANPRQTRRYPFMLTGPVSPLAANSTPVMLYAYTDFDEFRTDNAHWIEPARARLGLPVLTGNPTRPVTGSSSGRARKAKTTDLRSDIIRSNREASGNRKATGLLDAASFSDPLSGIDDDPAPF